MKTLRFLINKVVYLIGFFGVLIYIPQLIKVWGEQTVAGLSLTSWVGITLGSVIWILYGIANKQVPLIIINSILVVVQGAIVLGIIMYS